MRLDIFFSFVKLYVECQRKENISVILCRSECLQIFTEFDCRHELQRYLNPIKCYSGLFWAISFYVTNIQQRSCIA